jgi:hypothetical protein
MKLLNAQRRSAPLLLTRAFLKKAALVCTLLTELNGFLLSKVVFPTSTFAFALSFSFTTVPLYDTLGTEAVQYILNQTELRVLFCSKDKINGLLDMKSSLPHLKVVVSMDAIDDGLKEKAKSLEGLFSTVFSF